MSPLLSPSGLEQESIDQALAGAAEYLSGTVLDVGCGAQPYASLARSRGCRYVGVDLSTASIPSPDVCADSLRLPFRDGSVETVLSTQVLEHVVNPFIMMREAARVLKRGGHLILTAPQVWPLHEEPYDYFRYTKYGLELLAREQGLAVIRISERAGGIHALAQLTGTMLYDRFGAKASTRLPMKAFFVPFAWGCRLLDRLFYYPKLTLGYLLIAKK